MIREVVKIDEEKCTGCGDCVPSCHEGALQIIDGKARLISDLMCDGLGACLGHCPEGAISIEKREAEPYDERRVMEIMVDKGENTVIAHLKHLKDQNEHKYLDEALNFLHEHQEDLEFNVDEVLNKIQNTNGHQAHTGCPGAKSMSFGHQKATSEDLVSGQSELQHWPVQLHLINPQAACYEQADVVLAADCVAFSLGDFHQHWLKGKSLAIACPKLDSSLESYIAKIETLIDHAKINTLTVMIMQVPCCSGLLQLAKMAAQNAARKVPIKVVIVGIEGEILQENWI